MNRKSSAVLISFLLVWSTFSAADDSMVSFPVRSGESLGSVLKRIPFCREKANLDTKAFSDFVEKNPETIDSSGSFVLSTANIEVPKSLLETNPNCKSSKPEVESRRPSGLTMSPDLPMMKNGVEEISPDAEKLGPEKSEKKPGSNQIRVSPFMETSQLHSTQLSTGAETVLDSKIEYGVELSAFHGLGDKWMVGIDYKIAKTGFNELSGLELKESFSSLQDIGIGLAYRIADRSRFSLMGGAAQIDHVSTPEDGVVNVDAVWTPKVSAEFETELFHLGRVAMGLGFGGGIYLPSSQSTSLGSSNEAKIFSEYDWGERVSIGLEVSAGYQRQAFVNETHSLRAFGAAFGFGLHL